MSKKILNFLPFVFLLFILIFALIQAINIHRYNHPNVKAGQVWVRHDKDPFKSQSDTIYIIEVKDGYSRFRIEDRIKSDENKWVVMGAKLIKDVK